MPDITINLSLYGPIARYAGGTHIAQLDVTLPEGARMSDLIDRFQIPVAERGYGFINSILCDAPGLYASKDESLHHGDHIGLFSTTHMWPYQYRDGIHMTDSLKEAMRAKGVMRSSYRDS